MSTLYMHEFCDGCAAQYKRHCFGYVSESVSEFGFTKMIRNFFETSHAKGPQDAAGVVFFKSGRIGSCAWPIYNSKL